MNGKLSLVVLGIGLCLLSVKHWKLVDKQDTCLAGLDFNLKLVKQSEAQLSDARKTMLSVQAQKESEMGVLKKEKTGLENKLRMCERSTEDLVRDIEVKGDKIEEQETELRKVEADLEEMMKKFAKMKEEYTRSLAREDSLAKERDSLKESLDISQEKNHDQSKKDQELKDEHKISLIMIKKLEVKNADNLKIIHKLEEALQSKKDPVNNVNTQPKNNNLSEQGNEELPKLDSAEKLLEKNENAAAAPPPETMIENTNDLKVHGSVGQEGNVKGRTAGDGEHPGVELSDVKMKQTKDEKKEDEEDEDSIDDETQGDNYEDNA